MNTAIDVPSWNAAIAAAAATRCAYCGMGVPHAAGGLHAMWLLRDEQGVHVFKPGRRRNGTAEWLPCASVEIRALLRPEAADAG